MKTVKDAFDFIEQSKGRIFSVKFISRTTGEFREMTCRTGVTKHLAGGERAYDPAEHNLVYVYDMKNGYRCFPLDGLTEIKIDGEWHTIVK